MNRYLCILINILVAVFIASCNVPFKENYLTDCPHSQSERRIIKHGGVLVPDDVIIYEQSKYGRRNFYQMSSLSKKSVGYGFIVDSAGLETFYSELLTVTDTTILAKDNSYLQFIYTNFSGCSFVCTKNTRGGSLNCLFNKYTNHEIGR